MHDYIFMREELYERLIHLIFKWMYDSNCEYEALSCGHKENQAGSGGVHPSM